MSEYSCNAVHFPKCADHDRYGYAEAQHVTARLTYDYPLQTEEIWKYDNERNEEQSLVWSIMLPAMVNALKG